MGIRLLFFNSEIDSTAVVKPKPFTARPEVATKEAIQNIDFRRSEGGVGGKLVVDLNDPGVTIDTRESDGEIVVDLLGVKLPSTLERRLDVVDFATPVQTVDAFSEWRQRALGNRASRADTSTSRFKQATAST